MSVNECIVVIGASGGIGGAAVQALLSSGKCVVGLDKTETKPLVKADESLRYKHIKVDASDEGVLSDAFEEAAHWGRIQHVITTAGGALETEVEVQDPLKLSSEVFAQSIDVNLTAAFVTARCALRHLREGEGDRSLTFTSSINALAGIGIFGYSAAKAGLVALTRNLAVSEGVYGVRVNVVAPGTVRTLKTEELHKDPEHFSALENTTARGKLVELPEIGAFYASVVTSMSAVTGQTLVVDAGQLAKWR